VSGDVKAKAAKSAQSAGKRRLVTFTQFSSEELKVAGCSFRSVVKVSWPTG
jgi:hypothetical protein